MEAKINLRISDITIDSLLCFFLFLAGVQLLVFFLDSVELLHLCFEIFAFLEHDDQLCLLRFAPLASSLDLHSLGLDALELSVAVSKRQ